MKLILVRHGESARNAGYGIPNEENNLTIKGVQQAVNAAKKLTEHKIDAIYCSPSKRCEQTMDEILRLRDDDLQIHFSSLIGPKTNKERYEKLKTRIALFLDDLKYDHEGDQTVLVVTHQLAIRMFIFQLLGTQEQVENGSVTMLEIEGETAKRIE